jgi:hypothetical protein
MPDFNLMLRAMAVTAALAFGVTAAAAVLWRFASRGSARTPSPTPVALAAALAVGAGFFVGCWLLMEVPPRWAPREDQDRLLLLLLPAVVLVECVAAFRGVRWWPAWLLRVLVAAGAARVLLHDSSYLTDPSGSGANSWTGSQQMLVFGGLAALLAAVWASLTLLLRRAPGRSVSLALAGTCAGAALTVMLSGYLTGGQLGLPLGAALLGTVAASLLVPIPVSGFGSLGVALVGLFSVLVIGRFFGSLTTTHALVLFMALLLCWVPEAPYLNRLRPWIRGVIRVVLVAVPVVVVVLQAREEFLRDSQSFGSTSPDQPTVQDYLDFKGP